MTDLVVDYETTRPDLRAYSEEMMGGSPATAPERFRERSPIHFVQNIQGKLLIIQGANDPNVTPQNVADVKKRLDMAGIPYDVLIFEDEGHGIGKPANRRILLKRLAGFFADAFA
jgi:dipeptidyl aminopeptidase/acylaminoacyl peptidase